FLDLESLCRIHHVIRGESVVQPPRLRANLFRNRGGKGDYVVLYFAFDFTNALDVEVAKLSNRLSGLLRNQAGFRQRETGGGFHLEPTAELVFVAPDAAHFRAGVTRDQ